MFQNDDDDGGDDDDDVPMSPMRHHHLNAKFKKKTGNLYFNFFFT